MTKQDTKPFWFWKNDEKHITDYIQLYKDDVEYELGIKITDEEWGDLRYDLWNYVDKDMLFDLIIRQLKDYKDEWLGVENEN